MNDTIKYWPDVPHDGLTQIGETLMTSEHEALAYIPTGISGLDSTLHGGLPRGSVTVLAMRPILEIKTIPLEIAHHVASQTSKTVCLFDTKNDASVSALHMLSKLAGCQKPYQWSDAENPDILENAWVQLHMLPIYVASKPGMKIGWLKKRLERAMKENGLQPDLIIVDSIQGMDETESREDGVDKVMRQLKKIARRYEVAVIVTTDLKRDMESPKNRGTYLLDCPHPSMRKLADLVLYIYNEAIYDPETKSQSLELHVGENRYMPRFGAVDSIKSPIR